MNKCQGFFLPLLDMMVYILEFKSLYVHLLFNLSNMFFFFFCQFSFTFLWLKFRSLFIYLFEKNTGKEIKSNISIIAYLATDKLCSQSYFWAKEKKCFFNHTISVNLCLIMSWSAKQWSFSVKRGQVNLAKWVSPDWLPGVRVLQGPINGTPALWPELQTNARLL